MHILFSFFVALHVFAQSPDQPVKGETEDLRKSTQLFKIEDVKANRTYELDRTAVLEHYLRLKSGSDEELRKVDSRDAKKLDAEFATRFLKILYEIPEIEGDCKVTLRLTLKGEEQKVCEKDEKKSQEVVSFLQELAKRF